MDNKNYEIITRKSSDCKFYLFNFLGGVTIKEVIILFITLIINILISLCLIKINFWLSISFFIIFLIFSFLLIAPIKDENLKLYQYLKYQIMFIINNKKYKQIYLNENCMVKNIVNNLIIFKNNSFAKIYEIDAEGINDNNDTEISIKTNNFYNLLKSLSNIDFDIIKFDLPINISEQINYLNNIINDKNNFYYGHKSFKSYLNKIINLKNNSAQTKSHFFLIIKSNNETNLNKINDLLLKNKYSNIQLSIPPDDINNYIGSYFTFSNFINDIWINKDYIKVDNFYYLLKSISKFPFQVFPGWGQDFFNINNIDVVLKKHSLTQIEAIKRIDRSIQRAEALEGNKTSKQIEKNEFLDDFIKLQNYIKLNNENINIIEIFFIVSASSLNELKEKEIELNNKLYVDDFKLKNYKYNQSKLINKLLISNYKSSLHSQEISNRALSLIWPFNQKSLNDKNGLFIGNNIFTGEPIFFDIKKRDNFRINSNTLIIGKTGSGKTYNAKNHIYWNMLNNIKTFVIDPEREYHELANNFKGTIFTFDKNLINPLEIISSSIESQSELFQQFLKIMFSEIKSIELFFVHTLLLELYKKFNITNDNIFNQKIWPTILDLFNLINLKHEFKNSNLKGYILKLVNTNLWNSQTVINSSSLITVFDIYNLSDFNNLKSSQLFLLTTWIDKQIKNNRLNNLKYNLNNWVSLIIDEAHLLLTSDNLITLNYISQLTKRIRKYNGILILVSQNVNDFLGNDNLKQQTTAIINNLQYIFIHQLASNDLNNLNELLKIQRKLTTYQKNFLAMSLQGECLLINNTKFEYLKIASNF